MDKQEFLDLVWRFEELIMKRDHLRSQIGQCGEGCDEEDEGLCPECCEIFELVQDEDEKLARNKELDTILKQLKDACDADLTEEYQRILDHPRDCKVVH